MGPVNRSAGCVLGQLNAMNDYYCPQPTAHHPQAAPR